MSYPIELLEEFEVQLLEYAGGDELICQAARVSTLGSEATNSQMTEGLISYLMKNRHGSPFEHGLMTFRIKAPIFVWREFMRHRIGISYNEQSGRYMEMVPEFYMPPAGRNLIQEGKPGHYTFLPGDVLQREQVRWRFEDVYKESWYHYMELLKCGVAKEVARIILPLGIYSSAYVTMNPRSLMHFLSLRTKDPKATFPSFPMFEIEQVALQMEDLFETHHPITHKWFDKNGRVAP